MQQTLLQRGLDYTNENKREQLFTERGKFDYTRSAEHVVVKAKVRVKLSHCAM
jgi:hypothetical protein